jgi:hypothetical protein
MFQKATKKKLRARIALDGPAGSGKTYTALRFAFALAGNGGRVAVIDTEHRSASKYQGESPDGVPWEFDVCEMEYYSPSAYTQVVKEAGNQGYNVLVIDSLSHGWEGTGGALDLVDKKSNKGGSNYFAWRDVTPLHREMIETILASPCHVVATIRTKTAYEVDQDEKTKKVRVTKVGTKPVQREGMEYEFDVVGDLDLEHILVISKSRCSALDGKWAVKPAGDFIRPLIEWLGRGVDEPMPAPQPQSQPAGGITLDGKEQENRRVQYNNSRCGDEFAQRVKMAAKAAKIEPQRLLEIIQKRGGVGKVADLAIKDAEELLAKLEAKAQEADAPF